VKNIDFQYLQIAQFTSKYCKYREYEYRDIFVKQISILFSRYWSIYCNILINILDRAESIFPRYWNILTIYLYVCWMT